MKAKEVSVSVVQFPDGIHVMVTLKLPGHTLGREVAAPDGIGDATKVGTRVKESSRRAKAKEIRKVLETVEFPDA